MIEKMDFKIKRLQMHKRRNKISPEWRTIWYKSKIAQHLMMDYMWSLNPWQVTDSISTKKVTLHEFWCWLTTLQKDED